MALALVAVPDAGQANASQEAPAVATADAGATQAPWLELPDDPLGRLWASVGPETKPWAGAQMAVDADGGAWESWAKSLTALDGAPDARRDAISRLARIAHADGRVADAYEWIAAFGADDPEALAGLVPALFPGIPVGVALQTGGGLPALPDGAVLRPQLPPRSSLARRGSIENRRATARRITVGAATFDMLLKVDGSGVVCDLTHVAGDACKLRVQLPAPDGFRLKSAYIDWEIQELPTDADPATYDWSEVPLEVNLEAREDSFSLFARIERAVTPFPTPPSANAVLPRTMEDEGLVLVVADAEPLDAWRPVARAWSTALALEVQPLSAAAFRAESATGGAPVPIAIRFDRAPDPTTLRRLVTSAIEARIRDRGED